MKDTHIQNKFLIGALSAFLILMAAGSRLIEHPANFAPLGAIALLSAFYVKSKWSLMIPLFSLMVSDLVLGGYHWQVMVAVYASYALIWGIGRFAVRQNTKWALLPGALFASFVHFLLTNAAVWAFTGMYEANLSGLLLSYTMAIPFFKWTLAGDIFYSAVFVATIEAARFTASRVVSQQAMGGDSVTCS